MVREEYLAGERIARVRWIEGRGERDSRKEVPSSPAPRRRMRFCLLFEVDMMGGRVLVLLWLTTVQN